jgi:hypothetical protein
MSMTVTVIDNSSVELEGGEFSDELVTFAGTDTFAKGTILARDTSTQKLVLFVKGGSTNGNGIPAGVLTYPISRTGAGDVKARVLIAGKVAKGRLVIDAQGDDSAIDGIVRDQLRSRGIVPVDVQQLGALDN